MRIVLIGTRTKHRTFLINRLASRFPGALVGLVFERRRLAKPYPVGPFFDAEEAAYEERFFDSPGGVSREFEAGLDECSHDVYSANRAEVIALIRALAPDVIVASGAGRVVPEVCALARWGAVNIHLGLAQYYRGLDSNLWAVYESRFDRLGVTVHYMEPELDVGAVLAQATFQVGAEDEIFHLRYKATLLADRLLHQTLERLVAAGSAVPAVPQLRPGPYFSSMPLEKKLVALENFRRYSGRRTAETRP